MAVGDVRISDTGSVEVISMTLPVASGSTSGPLILDSSCFAILSKEKPSSSPCSSMRITCICREHYPILASSMELSMALIAPVVFFKLQIVSMKEL